MCTIQESGDPEGWVDANCSEIPTTCGLNGDSGSNVSNSSVKSEAVGTGTPCGALTRNDGPACSFDTCPSVPCTGEWGPWDTDCESIACGTSVTKIRQWRVGQAPKFGGTACPVPETETCPIIPCPSDCVYVPGKGGDTEGWVDVECRDYNGTACDRNGSGQGRMYQTRSVQSDAVGDGAKCGALARDDGPECFYESCAPLDCEYHYIDATPTVCTPKENVCVLVIRIIRRAKNYNSDT